jgi:hypothetical protein
MEGADYLPTRVGRTEVYSGGAAWGGLASLVSRDTTNLCVMAQNSSIDVGYANVLQKHDIAKH